MQGRNYRGTTLLQAKVVNSIRSNCKCEYMQLYMFKLTEQIAPCYQLTHFSRRKRSTILLRLNLFATFLPPPAHLVHQICSSQNP